MSSTSTHTEGLAIEVRDLRKSYGETEAVRGVSFEVARGEVFCLLGPNGAGKTTIAEILEGYRTRTRRRRPRAGHRPGQRVAPAARAGRHRAAAVRRPDRSHGRRAGRDVRPLPRAQPRRGRGHLARRADREARRAGQGAVRRSAPAAGPGAGTGRRSGADLPRRAHHRLRSGGTAAGLVDDPLAVRAGQDDLPDHALHGRGAVPGRPRGGHARGRDHRRRAPRRARRARSAARRDPLHAAGPVVAGRSARAAGAGALGRRATGC